MHRLLIAAATAAILATSVGSAFADDYPPCTTRDQDHCRVTKVLNAHGVKRHHAHGRATHHHHRVVRHHHADAK